MEHSSNKGIILILSILFIVVMMIPITGLIIAPSEINWIEQPRYELGGHSLYDLFESDDRVRATRKNLFDKSLVTLDYRISPVSGYISFSENRSYSDYISVLPNTNYIRNIFATTWNYAILFYDINKNFIDGSYDNAIQTIPINCYYIRLNLYTADLDTTQFELGTVATTYETYINSEMVLAETLTYTGWDWIHFTGLEYFGLEYMDYDDLNDFYRLYISYKYH